MVQNQWIKFSRLDSKKKGSSFIFITCLHQSTHKCQRQRVPKKTFLLMTATYTGPVRHYRGELDQP